MDGNVMSDNEDATRKQRRRISESGTQTTGHENYARRSLMAAERNKVEEKYSPTDSRSPIAFHL